MRPFALPLLLLSAALAAFAQTAADPALLAEVQKIKAIDNHTHVQKVVAPGEQDTEYDALPCEALEPSGAENAGRLGVAFGRVLNRSLEMERPREEDPRIVFLKMIVEKSPFHSLTLGNRQPGFE